jgi:hypothetical protein
MCILLVVEEGTEYQSTHRRRFVGKVDGEQLP